MSVSEKLEVGTKIEYKNGQREWVQATITRVSKSSVWFKGMGYSSIRKTTFDNYPELYRISEQQ